MQAPFKAWQHSHKKTYPVDSESSLPAIWIALHFLNSACFYKHSTIELTVQLVNYVNLRAAYLLKIVRT